MPKLDIIYSECYNSLKHEVHDPIECYMSWRVIYLTSIVLSHVRTVSFRPWRHHMMECLYSTQEVSLQARILSIDFSDESPLFWRSFIVYRTVRSNDISYSINLIVLAQWQLCIIKGLFKQFVKSYADIDTHVLTPHKIVCSDCLNGQSGATNSTSTNTDSCSKGTFSQ